MRTRNKQKERRELMENYSFILQFGLNMIVPIFGCTLLGAYLDDKWSVNYLCIIGFVMGAAAGYTSIYKMLKKRFKKEKKENEDEKHP